MAAGFAALEIGSDIGGSVRVPAHYCGVFGHKPSWGLCSGRGQSLVPVAGMTDIAVIGPLARSAHDLSLALDTIAGGDPLQDVGSVTLPPPRALRLAELRIAVWSSEPGQETDTETPALPHMQQGETWERQVIINGRTVPYNEMLFWPGVTCGFHLPASVAPIGMSAAGLPIGVQVVGPFHGDRTTLHVAGLLEQQWRSFVPPAGWN